MNDDPIAGATHNRITDKRTSVRDWLNLCNRSRQDRPHGRVLRHIAMTLIEAIRAFDLARVGEVSESTRRWYFYDNGRRRGGKLWTLVLALGADTPITAVTVDDLRRWRRDLLARDTRWSSHYNKPAQAGGLSQDGFRNYIRAARQFFKWLVDEGLLEENPAERLRVPPTSTDEPKAIDLDDARRVLRVAYVLALRDRAYWYLYQAGARIGELDTLRLEATAVTEIVVSRRVATAVYQPHALTLDATAAAALRAWLSVRSEVTAVDENHLTFTARAGRFPLCLKGGLCFGVRNWALIETLASTACRAGGIASMRCDHLDLQQQVVTVWEKGRGGYPISRPVFLDATAVTALRLWCDLHPGGPWLFPGLHGQLRGDGVARIVTALAQEAGVSEHGNPHAWRHAWSIEALRAGADVTTVAHVLGNRPETVMLSYARWAPNHIQQRHEQFNWRNQDADQRPKDS